MADDQNHRLCIDFTSPEAMFDFFRDAVHGRAAIPMEAAICETDALDFRRGGGVTPSRTFIVKGPANRKVVFSVSGTDPKKTQRRSIAT